MHVFYYTCDGEVQKSEGTLVMWKVRNSGTSFNNLKEKKKKVAGAGFKPTLSTVRTPTVTPLHYQHKTLRSCSKSATLSCAMSILKTTVHITCKAESSRVVQTTEAWESLPVAFFMLFQVAFSLPIVFLASLEGSVIKMKPPTLTLLDTAVSLKA